MQMPARIGNCRSEENKLGGRDSEGCLNCGNLERLRCITIQFQSLVSMLECMATVM